MDSLDKARETQLINIQNKTGKNLDELRKLILNPVCRNMVRSVKC